MGIFGSSRKTIVSSVVYNMAGDEDQRPNYLKSVIAGGVFSETDLTLGQKINRAYLKGPGISLRSFGRWARNSGYDTLLGFTAGSLLTGDSINLEDLIPQLPHSGSDTVIVQQALIGTADYTYWADQYMAINFPTEMNTAWSCDFDEGTGRITITHADTSLSQFTPVGFDPLGRYLYVYYTTGNGEVPGALVTGPTVILDPSDPLPSTVGWEAVSVITTPIPTTLHRVEDVLVTYSDGRPNETSHTDTPTAATITNLNGSWRRTQNLGANPNNESLQAKRFFMYQVSTGSVETDTTVTTVNENIGGGVIKTTQTTVNQDYIEYAKQYRIDEQFIALTSTSGLNVYIYQRGGGNAVLDAMFNPPVTAGTFFPFIPFRINNNYVSNTYLPDIYPMAKKAIKKALGGKYDKIVAQIDDNPSIGDIDFAYSVFGVSLNVKEVACRQYIYQLFKQIMFSTGDNGLAYLTWADQWRAAAQAQADWAEWEGQDPSSPWYGQPEPELLPFPNPPQYTIRVASTERADLHFDMVTSWFGSRETNGTGLKKPGAKRGDLWFEYLGHEEFSNLIFSDDMAAIPSLIYQVQHIQLHWQDGNNSWRTLDIWGLNHTNTIYGGKSVDISGAEALADTEESGFIIPLHEDVFKSLPLTVSTQMSTACSFLVFNCYEVVKQKWYQTGAFQIIIIIVIIVITVMSAGAGSGTAPGLLGTNVAVGTALGFTGAAAVIAGAIANAIAAMLLAALIQKASKLLLGDKIGSIVGFVASIIAIQAGTAYSSGASFAGSISSLSSVSNILKLTVAGVNAISEYINAGTRDLARQSQELTDEYNKQIELINQAQKDNLGNALDIIDPMQFTQADRQIYESLDTFLSRTLLTGSEVASMSLDLLTNFADATLNLDLPT